MTLFARFFLFASALSVGAAWAVEPAPHAVRILALEPTVLFPRREHPAQVARLMVVNESGAPLRCDAVVTVRGGGEEKIAGIQLAPHQSLVDVLVPDIPAEATVDVQLLEGGKVLAAFATPWHPQRKWTVYIIKSSHEDIGYENYIFKKEHDIANFIDLAREQSSPKSVASNIAGVVKQESSFHYTMETILFQRNYIEERGEKAWRDLVENDLKTGHMALMGAPSGVHSHWMDYEELARMAYPARRETRDRFGLDLKTFMIVDNPSLSWSGAQVLANAGFKYVARWGQEWRSGGHNDYATTHVPALFWWQGPDGVSKILFGWRSHYAMGFWYGQTSTYPHLLQLAKYHVSDLLKQVESGALLGPYPYDALVTPEYNDHDIPRFDRRVLPDWQAQFAYPLIKVASPEDFFAYIEKKYGPTLPVLRGDLNNFSADYATIDPVSQDWKRQAARLLPATEGLAVLAGASDPGFALRPADVERLYTRLFDYDEHCWPTLPPVTDEQLFNASWVKHDEARRALDGATALFHQAAVALAANLSSAGSGTFAVFNPLVHARSDLVELPAAATSVTDLRTGRVFPTEKLADGHTAFLASDIPSFGYALFRAGGDAAPHPSTELHAEPTSISNRYYTVRFDPQAGTVTSIVEKARGRELIDASAPYRANQLVYVHKNSRESKEGFEYSPPKVVRTASHVDATRAIFEAWIEDPKLGGKIHQTTTLHAGVKRVDFVNHLEAIAAMWSPRYEDRYCDNLYFAFPFAVPHGQIRAEYPGGVVRPYDDQLRWGSHDYLYANRWIDVSNADGGVTLASREAGTFSLGEIRYNQVSVDYKPSKPWLFNYAWSNRMAGLLTLSPADCNATFTYSVTSHGGDWNSGAATDFGWRTGSPLLVLPVADGAHGRWAGREKSFLSVDAPNVQLTVLKAAGVAGQGWVARFAETAGQATEFTLDASALAVDGAVLCNGVEDDTTTLTVKDGRARIALRPFGFATVRLLSGPRPGAVSQLRGSDITDATLRLAWTAPATKAGGYDIFRSDDPRAPATAYTIVARTAANEFTDRGLNVDTTYYYRVAAVSATNLAGPVSEPLQLTTSARNQSPPEPVREVGVVRRSPDTLIVYWRKSPEPDVAHYRVYRGDAPDFSIAGQAPIAVLDASSYFLQIYRDATLTPGKTYYYRVQPVDWADNRQPISAVAAGTTPKDHP